MSDEYLNLNDELAKVAASKSVPVVTEQAEPTVESEPTTEPTEDEVLASEEPETEEAESEPAKHRSKAAEKRIAKLIKEREQLKGQLALLNNTKPVEIPTYNETDPNLPNPANYPDGENDLDYRLDVREYQRNEAKKTETFRTKLQEAMTTYPDLPDLIEADEAKTNATMISIIKDSSLSVELFYFLMSNPDISNKIAKLSPAMSAKELGKIEAKLEAKATTPTKTVPVKKPLPPPISPVKATKTTVVKQTKYTEY